MTHPSLEQRKAMAERLRRAAQTRGGKASGFDDLMNEAADLLDRLPDGELVQGRHVLSDLEYVELIRTWRNIGFEMALQTANQFVDDGVLAVIAALEDMKTMMPPLPSKGN